MKEYNTYREISTQADGWEKNYHKIINDKFHMDKEIFQKNYDRILFFGCGSSYNLALSASFYTNSFLKIDTAAIPSSELLFNKDIYINKNRNYLLIGFSRSGETTESINVVKSAKDYKNIDTLVFTCNCSDNTIVNIADYNYCCEDSEEKSVVMTKSFSNMLISYCLMLAKFLGNKKIIDEFLKVIEYTRKNILVIFNEMARYIAQNDFYELYALGSGFNYGLAVEADLKVKEMTQIPAYSYHVMEFNHGPKSLIKEGSLCLFLTPNSYLERLDILIESYLSLGSYIIVVGRERLLKKNRDRIKSILDDENVESELVRSFINIPVFQIISLIKTVRLGLNPYKPRNLDYTTKIY